MLSLVQMPIVLRLTAVAMSCFKDGISQLSLSFRVYILSLLSPRIFSEPQKEWLKCSGCDWALNLRFSELLDILNGHSLGVDSFFLYITSEANLCSVIVIVLVLQEVYFYLFLAKLSNSHKLNSWFVFTVFDYFSSYGSKFSYCLTSLTLFVENSSLSLLNCLCNLIENQFSTQVRLGFDIFIVSLLPIYLFSSSTLC